MFVSVPHVIIVLCYMFCMSVLLINVMVIMIEVARLRPNTVMLGLPTEPWSTIWPTIWSSISLCGRAQCFPRGAHSPESVVMKDIAKEIIKEQ